MRRGRTRLRLVAAALVGAGCVAGAAGTSVGTADTTRWLPLRVVPDTRAEVAAARIGTRIYVTAGIVNGYHPDDRRLDIYDIKTDTWSQGAPMPDSLNHTAAVTHDGKLYLVDGYIGDRFAFLNSDGFTVAILLEYDPATNKWRELPSPPTPRGAIAAGVIGGDLYVAGGWNTHQGDQKRLEIYNFKTRRWRRGPDMQFARNHVVGTVAGGKFYAIGGHTQLFITDEVFSYVERFNPAAGRWERVADLHDPRSGEGVTTVGNRVVVYGGEARTRLVPSTEIFDPRTGVWSRLPDMLTPRHALGSVSYGNRVYAIQGGGQLRGGKDSNAIEYLNIPPPKSPRLHLSISPRRVRAGVWTRFRFKVTARTGGWARPVERASIRFAGSVLLTNRSGRATLVKRLWRPGAHWALAKKPGYRTTAAAVHVRHKQHRR